MFKKQIQIAMFLTGLMVPAFGQEVFNQDAAVQITGNFTRQSTENGLTQDQSDSAGVLASYRYFFHRNHGVEFNYGYTRNNLVTSLGGLTASQKLNGQELTAAYVVRFPKGRVTPFALAGAGGYLYDGTFSGSTITAKPTFIYGAGADLHVSSRAFIRAQYRGQIHQSLLTGPGIVTSGERWLHTAQPSVGFGFRF